MTCREFAEFMADYLSRELAAPVRASFDAHLEICVNCQRYLVHYRESTQLGRAAFSDPDAPVPPDVPEDLIAAILASRK
jgi:anti-sigma factor RsiW